MVQDFETERLQRIIVGLGNPGEQYSRTRHNAGFMTLEALAREAGSGDWSTCMSSRTCKAVISGCQVLLVEPLTYMNNSGKAVQVLLSALGRAPRDLLLIFDDLNLPFGRIRVRERGSSGGHHGLDSIVSILKTEEILRVRLGIGEEQMPEKKSDFVLSEFPAERLVELDKMISKAGNAVKSILKDGVSRTMAIYN